MDLSIVIVNYQTFEMTKNTINSVLEYDYPFSYEILVVDNASSDDSLAKLQDYFKDKVKFIASAENNGFAAGNNQALKVANGKYILLLNSDTIVWENTLKNIYDYMYSHIREKVAGKDVLELATGPGLIAKNVADVTHRMVATDFSSDMIKESDL